MGCSEAGPERSRLPARYVYHTGERPMSITWALEFPMPAAMYARAKVAAG